MTSSRHEAEDGSRNLTRLVAAEGVEQEKGGQTKAADQDGQSEHDPSRILEDGVDISQNVEQWQWRLLLV